MRLIVLKKETLEGNSKRIPPNIFSNFSFTSDANCIDVGMVGYIILWKIISEA